MNWHSGTWVRNHNGRMESALNALDGLLGWHKKNRLIPWEKEEIIIPKPVLIQVPIFWVCWVHSQNTESLGLLHKTLYIPEYNSTYIVLWYSAYSKYISYNVFVVYFLKLNVFSLHDNVSTLYLTLTSQRDVLILY